MYKLYIYITTALSIILGSTSKNVYIHEYSSLMNGENDTESALTNGLAFYNAVTNSKEYDTIVLLSNETIYYIPYSNSTVEYIDKIRYRTIQIDGNIILHDNISAWSMQTDDKYCNAIDIRNSDNVIITGTGTIDGQGSIWWWEFLLGEIPRQRPTMIQIKDTSNILIENITMLNSPRFNIDCNNIFNMETRHVTIWVDAQEQINLQKKYIKVMNTTNKINVKIPPMFPFNTDGIDVSGKNIYVHSVNISNYDDSIAIKPTHVDTNPIGFDDIIVNCTENATIKNMNIERGVGLSIGSVSSYKNNCIRNILFENISAHQALKFIYIKTGGFDNATDIEGTIENVIYRNMTANGTILWAIYIGGQQQQEPDGTGGGFFPIPIANPYVSIRNITLENIHIINSNYYAGVIMCNISNPCEGINIVNVSVIQRQFFKNKGGYICSDWGSIYGSFDNLSIPLLDNCINTVT